MNPTTYLFGSTSVIGWNLWTQKPTRDVLAFCNAHARLPSGLPWKRLNLEDRSAYKDLFRHHTPRLLIHCGGICDVDKCETHPSWAHDINVRSLHHLLEFCPRETRLVYVSSDHVFGGRRAPYTERSQPDPLTVYGKTRVQAEKLMLQRAANTLVLRPGLPIGSSFNGKTGHLNWIQYRTKKKLPITLVEDEFRSAVWAKTLADRVWAYAQSPLTGLRHLPATRAVSRPELAHFLNKRYKIGARFAIQTRKDRPVPHLGRVELQTIYKDKLAASLTSVTGLLAR